MGQVVLCVPYEGHLGTKPVLVGWCREAKLVSEPYKPHELCDMEDCLETRRFHYYHKKLMWPCRLCDHYYSSYNRLLNHACEWE